jgi:hypothetical protein
MDFDENAIALQRDVPTLHTGDTINEKSFSSAELAEQMAVAYQRGCQYNFDKLKGKIQDAIDNIRKLKPDAGSTRAFGESYDEGRADAYAVVLGWLDELEKK